MGFKQKIYLILGILLVLGYGIFSIFSYINTKKHTEKNNLQIFL